MLYRASKPPPVYRVKYLGAQTVFYIMVFLCKLKPKAMGISCKLQRFVHLLTVGHNYGVNMTAMKEFHGDLVRCLHFI